MTIAPFSPPRAWLTDQHRNRQHIEDFLQSKAAALRLKARARQRVTIGTNVIGGQHNMRRLPYRCDALALETGEEPAEHDDHTSAGELPTKGEDMSGRDRARAERLVAALEEKPGR